MVHHINIIVRKTVTLQGISYTLNFSHSNEHPNKKSCLQPLSLDCLYIQVCVTYIIHYINSYGRCVNSGSSVCPLFGSGV